MCLRLLRGRCAHERRACPRDAVFRYAPAHRPVLRGHGAASIPLADQRSYCAILTSCMSNSNMQDSPGFLVGTAGHIDHGKTALVRALTGIDTDRLAEEKQR